MPVRWRSSADSLSGGRLARLLGSLGRRLSGGTGLALNPLKTEVLLLGESSRWAWEEECRDPNFFFGRARTPEQARYVGFQLRSDLSTGDVPNLIARVGQRVRHIRSLPASASLWWRDTIVLR